MQEKSILQLKRWRLAILALLLLLIGILEYPRALEKMRFAVDAWRIIESTGAMMLAAGVAFWIGWRAQWLSRLEQIPSRYWITAAIILAIFPSLMGWNVEGRPVWKTGIPGTYIDPALLSMLAFFGWIASLRNSVHWKNPPPDWKQLSAVVLFGILWGWVIAFVDIRLVVAVVALPVAMVMLRGTQWFRAMMVSVGVCGLSFLAYIAAYPYRFERLFSLLFPFDDPSGKNYVSHQIRKSLDASGWFGSDSFVHLPNATHHFMLATIGEHFGLIVLLLVVGVITFFFLSIRSQLFKLPESWLRHFATAIFGFMAIGSAINLIANLGLTGPAGLSIPFLSRDWFLAGMAAFLIGVTLRNQSVAVSPELTSTLIPVTAHLAGGSSRDCC